MPLRRLFATLLVLIPTLLSFAYAGPVGISRYSGARFPYSASVVVQTNPESISVANRVAAYLDSTGSRTATHIFGTDAEQQPGLGRAFAIVSAADPTVVYTLSLLERPDSVDVLRIVDGRSTLLRRIPLRRPFGNLFASFLPPRLNRDGSDVVCFRTGEPALAAIIDTDGDHLADSVVDRDGDTYDDHDWLAGIEVAAIDANGTAWGFKLEDSPSSTTDGTFAYTIRDSDGDLIPDTPAWPNDPQGRIEIPGAGRLGLGNGTVDEGGQRLIVSFQQFQASIDIDSHGILKPESFKPLAQFIDDGQPNVLRLYSAFLPAVQHDGSVVAHTLYENVVTLQDDSGVYVLDDLDFDGTSIIHVSGAVDELLPTVIRSHFDPYELVGAPSVPELTELRSFVGGVQIIAFVDFGIWPDGRSFSFKQSGVERNSVTVSVDGLLSFGGSVSASPSLASLESTPGLVAPAWSDQWDTSQVRVFAGCAPVQRRFADGSGSAALSFVIEWRGLISPNGKRTSLRCLLLEDGSFRVDYGAMEVGSMPLVVGYSTDGAGAIVTDDLSDNSWGGQPVGTLEEAALGEEFGATKPFDLSHKWIRFAGYGDVRGPRPELIAVALKKGNKIQMRAAGSNIQTGATLVVDGVETFELKKSATGSKWVVTKKVTSTPGARSVESIWSDGGPHSIVVVNPDGGRSVAFNLD